MAAGSPGPQPSVSNASPPERGRGAARKGCVTSRSLWGQLCGRGAPGSSLTLLLVDTGAFGGAAELGSRAAMGGQGGWAAAPQPHLPEAVGGLLRTQRGLIVGAGHGVAVGSQAGLGLRSAGWTAQALGGQERGHEGEPRPRSTPRCHWMWGRSVAGAGPPAQGWAHHPRVTQDSTCSACAPPLTGTSGPGTVRGRPGASA